MRRERLEHTVDVVNSRVLRKRHPGALACEDRPPGRKRERGEAELAREVEHVLSPAIVVGDKAGHD